MTRPITRTAHSPPDPVLLNESGDPVRVRLRPQELKIEIDQKYKGSSETGSGRPSRLTKCLNEADQNVPVSPRLVLSARTAKHDVERPVYEMSVLGQYGAGFPENRNKLVQYNSLHNGFPMPATADLSLYESQGRRTADSYVDNKLIGENDSVLEVGTCLGFVPEYLKQKGIKDITCIEPDINGIKERVKSTGKSLTHKIFEEILPLSIQEYLRINKGKKFSVVNICNFFPDYNCYGNEKVKEEDIQSVIGAASELTSEDGKFLLGVSSLNPEYISWKLGVHLKPFLEKFFNSVEYISATKFKEFDDYFSVGGQMGVFKCTEPKT